MARLLITICDVTEQRQADERLRHIALHDALTGLPNRAFFQEKLKAAIDDGKATDARVGLLMLDIDHLKQTNDIYGHDAGDALLVMFAERLLHAVRKGDTVARLGGDEFAVVLGDFSNRNDIARVGERITAAMEEPFTFGDAAIECRPSIGVSIFPGHGTTPADLLKSADIALYTAKSSARGTTLFFTPKMRQEARGRRSKIVLARTALAEDQIEPFYQPKIDLATGGISGFEALLRWRRTPRSIMNPSAIAPAFEDSDLAIQISDRIMSRAIRDARAWLDKGVEFGSIAINAGAIELHDKRFADRFLHQMSAGDVPPSLFQLEVVETVFLGHGTEHVEVTLRQLNNEGVQIALDDFGTGYASLTHLQKFPVDILKVDRSFVGSMGRGGGNTAVVDAIVGLGRSLNVDVVAEGIETLEQADHLREIGCAYGQGYLFSKALPASRVPGLLRAPPQDRLFASKAKRSRRAALSSTGQRDMMNVQ